MKQYTTPEQTAKLIELGFEKPKASHRYWRGNELIINNNYSIGELIEMLMTIKGVRISFVSMFGDRLALIVKRLVDDKWDILYGKVENESIDLLFDAIVKLKEEGVI